MTFLTKSWSIFLFSLFASVWFGECQIDPITQTIIDELIENVYIEGNHAPALGLSIVKDGQVLYNTGYGLRDVENGIRAHNGTLFFIGSNSKSFTALIVIKTLHENFPALGEAALDTPISQLIPAYNFTLGDRYRTEATTFRDILAHRTGTLPDGAGTFFGAITNVSELVYRQRYAPEIYPFRTNFLYDNGNFAIAGELAAAISGVPFLDMLNNLFVQIGMRDATYIKDSDNHDNMLNRAIGYYRLNGVLGRYNSELYKRVVPMIAAGGILSSADDMAKYMQFHLNNGRVGSVQVIPEDVMKWLHKISNPLSTGWKTSPDARVQTELGYSLGLFISAYDGWLMVSHGGYLTPFNSQMSLFPALNLGIFTVTSGPGRLLPNISHAALHLDLFDILQGQSLPKQRGINITSSMLASSSLANTEHRKLPSKRHRTARTFQNRQNEEILGHYGNGQSGELEVIQKLNDTGDTELYMEYGPWGLAFLRPTENVGELLLVWDSDLIQEYYTTNPNARVTVFYDNMDKTITFFEDGFPVGTFEKDQHLDDLPPVPWSPDSCGPESRTN